VHQIGADVLPAADQVPQPLLLKRRDPSPASANPPRQPVAGRPGLIHHPRGFGDLHQPLQQLVRAPHHPARGQLACSLARKRTGRHKTRTSCSTCSAPAPRQADDDRSAIRQGLCQLGPRSARAASRGRRPPSAREAEGRRPARASRGVAARVLLVPARTPSARAHRRGTARNPSLELSRRRWNSTPPEQRTAISIASHTTKRDLTRTVGCRRLCAEKR